MNMEDRKFEAALREIAKLHQMLDEHHISYSVPDWLHEQMEHMNALKPDAVSNPSLSSAQNARKATPARPRSVEQPNMQKDLSVREKTQMPDQKMIREESASARVRQESAMNTVQPGTAQESSASASSVKMPLEQATQLMLRRFHGRADRYSLQARNGKFYQPCQRQADGTCQRRTAQGKFACKGCTDRIVQPIEPGMYADHLSGRRALAISPLLEDGRVWFVCFEFVGEAGKKKSQSILQAARSYGMDGIEEIPAYDPENALRLWFFFAIPIDANRAANFATSLLLNAIAAGELTDFSAFDEVFPKPGIRDQKTYIRPLELPLFGCFDSRAALANKKKTGFLDRERHLADHPFELLERIEGITPAQIDTQIKECRAYSRYELFNGEGKIKEDEAVQPRLLFDDNPDPFHMEDLSACGMIRLVQKGRIWICTDHLSSKSVAQLMAMGSYWNPAYTRKNAKYANGSRVISLARKEKGIPFDLAVSKETDAGKFDSSCGASWISLPRHLLDQVLFRLNQAGASIQLDDKRVTGTPVNIRFNAQLRPEQVPLQAALLEQGSGILEAATGTGKTVIGASLIAAHSTSTLVLVNSKEILQGWVEALNKFLEFENPEFEQWKAPSKNYPGKIGVLQASTNTLSGRVDIAMVPSLASKKDLEKITAPYGLVLVDECHHAGSATNQAVLDALASRYVYGFSATPNRTDGKSKSMYWQLGEIAASFTSKEQMEAQSFDRLVCPRLTPFAPSDPDSTDFLRICQEAANHPMRNEMIIADVKEALANGRTVLVLTRFVEHAHLLARALENDKEIELFIYAGDPVQKLENTRRLKSLSRPAATGKKVVLVGTYASISEGFDYPALDTLMLALPVRSQIMISQSIGRIHRQIDSKDLAIVYDYADVQSGMLERMYRDRLAEYLKQGYRIGTPLSSDEGASMAAGGEIYSGSDYLADCQADLQMARSKIAMCARQIEDEQAQRLLSSFAPAIARGVRADVFVEEISEPLQRRFAQARVHVHLHPRITAPCLILDQELIWYGNVFSKAADAGGMLRIRSKRDARELLEVRRKEEIRLLTRKAQWN